MPFEIGSLIFVCVCVEWKNATRNGSISGISILGKGEGHKKWSGGLQKD